MELLEKLYSENPGIGRRSLCRLTGLSERSVRKWLEDRRKRGLPSHPMVSVDGLTPRVDDPKGIWEKAKQTQKETMKREEKRYSQSITIREKKPIVIAFLSDFHCGSALCDYEGLEQDITTIQETEGMYAVATGDYHDNWINTSLMHLQRYQCMPLSSEITPIKDIFSRLSGKLLAVVAGNHDSRTEKLAGFDHIEQMLAGAKLLYDSGEVLFQLNIFDCPLKVKCRHSFKGHSMYNPTHGAEKDLRFGDEDWDVAVSGHHHVGTVFREFIHRNSKKFVVLVGAYKYHDPYGRLLNFPRTFSRSCGGMLLMPDGSKFFCDNLQMLQKLLEHFRG